MKTRRERMDCDLPAYWLYTDAYRLQSSRERMGAQNVRLVRVPNGLNDDTEMKTKADRHSDF